MRYALLSVASLAGLGLSLPQETQASDAAKLAWVVKGSWPSECGYTTRNEQDCGTVRWCSLFDDDLNRRLLRDRFDSSRACLDAHEDRPKQPWEKPKGPDDCAGAGAADGGCNMISFCGLYDRKEQGGLDGSLAQRYDSADDCLNQTVRKPQTWYEPGESAGECNKYTFEEEQCGTEKFCGLFYTNPADCFAAHEPGPGAKATPPSRPGGYKSTADNSTADWHGGSGNQSHVLRLSKRAHGNGLAG